MQVFLFWHLCVFVDQERTFAVREPDIGRNAQQKTTIAAQSLTTSTRFERGAVAVVAPLSKLELPRMDVGGHFPIGLERSLLLMFTLHDGNCTLVAEDRLAAGAPRKLCISLPAHGTRFSFNLFFLGI